MPRPKRFDPEGTGYDYNTAILFGLGPDKTKHWSSREPRTGQILKGAGHPTFHKTVQGEKDAGYEIEKVNGKYYSKKKKPIGMKPQKLLTDF